MINENISHTLFAPAIGNNFAGAKGGKSDNRERACDRVRPFIPKNKSEQ